MSDAEMREAMLYDKQADGTVVCRLCHHGCRIPDGGAGFCCVRENTGGTLYASGYGRVSALNPDPIEKKPLYRFHPGKMILSAGGFGCNLRCPFCQNHDIAALYTENGGADSRLIDGQAESFWHNADVIPPEKLARFVALKTADGNIGLAYTYNEPTVGIEYILDCARLINEAGLFNVLVTNGSVSAGALALLLPLTDAMNIDVKGFTEAFYKKLSGDLQTVKRTVEAAAGRCHVEVTTLIIPGENDSDEEIDALSRWLAGISPDIPLHLTRFFPRHKYGGKQPTPRETVLRLKGVAERHCRYVYAGNMM
jgi:pyruvate formate lyase activating enzyme